MKNSIISRLLRKNTSPARVALFLISNFIGLAIVMGAIQFYSDARDIWSDNDSFIKTDYLVVNKKVTGANLTGSASSEFSATELSDINAQPWVRSSAPFTAGDFKVFARVATGNHGMSTYMFFESIPDRYVDVPASQWSWQEGSREIPIIIPKDYLALYNFGFAASAGLPQLSEGLLSGIPLELTLTSEDGRSSETFLGRVAGYSSRINSILVPDNFMKYANSRLGSNTSRLPSRLVIDVSSPGDVAIEPYLDDHNLEMAGDKRNSSAAFLLKLVAGTVIAVGTVITLLSLFILMLSISLILEKNRDTLHRLLMLGYDTATVARPYNLLVIAASAAAWLLALVGMLALRGYYLPSLAGLGSEPSTIWLSIGAGLLLSLLSVMFNLNAVKRKVVKAWRL